MKLIVNRRLKLSDALKSCTDYYRIVFRCWREYRAKIKDSGRIVYLAVSTFHLCVYYLYNNPLF